MFQIDPVTVKHLDKNLFLSDEIREVYREIMKTVPTDHLNLDHPLSPVNVAGTMASASLSKKRSQRVINPDLYHEKPPPWGQQDMKAWARTPSNPPKNFQGENIFAPITPNMDKIHEVMHNPTKMSQLMTNTSSMPSFVADKMSRTYASWLQWWKSTVTGDDYMKYLSTLIGDEEDENSKEKQPQQRLEAVWNSLQMPDALRLDMAIKYSCGDFFSRLQEAVERWESATEMILKREALLVKLEQFERSASDPNRFFEKVNGVKKSSVVLLEEARYRTYLYKKIESVDEDVKQELDYIKSKFQDIVSFKGRPYDDKMKWDRVEMLHWLQEERKHNALRFESLTRQIPLNLKPAQLQPITTGAPAAAAAAAAK
nr:hypothetical protein BaRGS_027919 [Batillaria attramentaria]